MNKILNRRLRMAKGSLLVELAASTVMVSIFTVLSMNIGIMLYGALVNDRACRTAVRAASQGTSQTEAKNLALSILGTIQGSNIWVERPKLDGAVIYDDLGGVFPPNHSPFVTVSTVTQVNLPVPITFINDEFLPGGKLQFRQTYTFPLMHVN